jgi:hypothetical protein
MVQIQKINNEEWTIYFTKMYKSDINQPNNNKMMKVNDISVEISKEVEKTLRSLKNRKSLGEDSITNELLKYRGNKLKSKLTKLICKIFVEQTIPEEWRTCRAIPLFKKGDKKIPDNYRNISLNNTTLKLTTKILANKLSEIVDLEDEQQGFRTGRSCVDAIFILKQVMEKFIEYNKPTYLCFIDLKKAFDQIIVQDVIKILQSKNVPEQMITLINNIYVNNKMKIRNNRELTQLITLEKGIRQGDSLSPSIFNIIMNEIIKSIKGMRGYRMGESMINLVVYADNIVLVAENEDDLQRMLFKFNNICKKFNMLISNQKKQKLW